MIFASTKEKVKGVIKSEKTNFSNDDDDMC